MPDNRLKSNDNYKISLLINNLKLLMQKKTLNEAQLARATKIPQPTLHKILAEKTIDPRISTLKTLADYFNTSIDSLYYGIGKPEATKHALSSQSIPILSLTDCIKNDDFIVQLSSSNWEDWLSVSLTGGCLYGIRTKPSMEPIFLHGTILVIDRKKTVKDGDLILVRYKGSQEAALRKLSIDGPNHVLFPVNPKFKSDNLNKEIKILGVVVQSIYTYE